MRKEKGNKQTEEATDQKEERQRKVREKYKKSA